MQKKLVRASPKQKPIERESSDGERSAAGRVMWFRDPSTVWSDQTSGGELAPIEAGREIDAPPN
jgi:hypothetical protein